MDRNALNQRLPQIVTTLAESVNALPDIRRLDDVLLPSKEKVVAIVRLVQQIVFPGFFGRQNVTHDNLPYRLGELVFRSLNPDQAWDGTYHGRKVSTGAFVWMVSYFSTETKQPVFKKGTVMVIR